jgi:Domain of unknown function (DUF397)
MYITWRKSSYSGGEGNCVAAAGHGNRVLVRDTQDRTGPVLRFSPAAWRVFADRVKRSLAPDLASAWWRRWQGAGRQDDDPRSPARCSSTAVSALSPRVSLPSLSVTMPASGRSGRKPGTAAPVP